MSNDEITGIRERLARIEATLEHISYRIDQPAARPTAGSVVLPVAVVVAVIELLTNLVGKIVA